MDKQNYPAPRIIARNSGSNSVNPLQSAHDARVSSASMYNAYIKHFHCTASGMNSRYHYRSSTAMSRIEQSNREVEHRHDVATPVQTSARHGSDSTHTYYPMRSLSRKILQVACASREVAQKSMYAVNIN